MKFLKIIAICSMFIGYAHANDASCIAEAIYFEARGESVQGQKAVAQVILNRVKIKKKSACSVINEKNQFSFKKNKKRKILDKESYARALKIAKTARPSPSFKMDSFSNYRAFNKPAVKIGNHYFVRQLG